MKIRFTLHVPFRVETPLLKIWRSPTAQDGNMSRLVAFLGRPLFQLHDYLLA